MNWLRMCAVQCMVAVGALTLAGCGRGTGTVSGKVTLNGTALPGGLVTVHDAEGQPRNGPINKDGTYLVSNITPGPAKISIMTLSTMPNLRDPNPTGKDPLGPYVAIPAKYQDPSSSGFTLEVKSGSQPYDLSMTGEAAPPPEQK
jgi:hypothetical protein